MTHSSGGYVVLSVPWHVDVLVKRIPEEDNKDMLEGWGQTSESMLRNIFPKCDECYTIMGDMGVVGMFGIMPDANIWLMRGKDIDTVAYRFVRHGHEYLQSWVKKYGKLTGYINQNYAKFVRWLIREGFEVYGVGRGYLQVVLDPNNKREGLR